MDRRRSRARLLGAPQLQVDLPLQILVEHHAAASSAVRKARTAGERGVAVGFGPLRPHPEFRILRGAGARRARSRWRTSPADRPRRARYSSNSRRARRGLPPLAQELREQQLQQAQLERRHALVLHERRARAAPRFPPRVAGEPQHSRGPPRAREILHPFHVQVQEVLVEDAVRQVGAGVERPPVVDGVQRIQAHEARRPDPRPPSPPRPADRENRRSPSCAPSARRTGSRRCPPCARRGPGAEACRRGPA